jgi:uncharacterized FlgJ-related protein
MQSKKVARYALRLPALFLLALCAACSADPDDAGAAATATDTADQVALPEVLVFSGPDEAIKYMDANDWWGADWHERELVAPRALLTGISSAWRTNAQQMQVATKKEIFYRVMLPLVLHANEMVLNSRRDLEEARATLAAGGKLSAAQMDDLRRGAVLFRVLDAEAADDLGGDRVRVLEIIDELLYRLDVVPPGLALGQAAYESGYGTSRFATEGNALFGQWTYGGEGLVPEQQRSQLGDHRIAAFEWPFDSVRGYFINLMSHPAYEDFRRLRAERRASGEPLSSLALADGLLRYSERGQAYVDELKGIIRVNKLDMADQATLRDEPLRLTVAVGSPEAAEELREELAEMRASGELAEMVERMQLE